MENKKKDGQGVKKPDLKIIDYIDDRGDRRRTYTTSEIVERYIKNTYSIVKNNPQSDNNLTP